MSHLHDASVLTLTSPIALLIASPFSAAMDVDGASSPPLRYTSLPPSSAPLPTPSSPSGSQATPRRNRQQSDGLGLADDEAVEAEQNGAASRRRGRPRGQVNLDVPIVKDAVGETVQEAFETFLRTYVDCFLPAPPHVF